MGTRNRERTKQRILEAVGALLAESGFQGIGINAVARRAGVDKVLIYRYFGGLPELLEAYAHESDFWWTVEEMVLEDDGPLQAQGPVAYLAVLLRRHVEALQRRPLTQEIMAWELTESNELTRTVALVRAARGHALVRRVRALYPDSDLWYLEGVLGLLGAGINHLILRTRHEESSQDGRPMHEGDWAYLQRVIEHLLGASTEQVSA
jgi:AcrR family transcriptional regulator